MPDEDELRPEYAEGFMAGGVRGKYAKANIVRLAPDVAAAFPNAAAVNEALRRSIKSPEDVGQYFRDSDIIPSESL